MTQPFVILVTLMVAVSGVSVANQCYSIDDGLSQSASLVT